MRNRDQAKSKVHRISNDRYKQNNCSHRHGNEEK